MTDREARALWDTARLSAAPPIRQDPLEDEFKSAVNYPQLKSVAMIPDDVNVEEEEFSDNDSSADALEFHI